MSSLPFKISFLILSNVSLLPAKSVPFLTSSILFISAFTFTSISWSVKAGSFILYCSVKKSDASFLTLLVGI